MKKTIGVRQGDVGILYCKIPAGAKRISIRPVALGEVTGHSHSLAVAGGVLLEDAVEMYELQGNTYLRVTEEGVSLVHEQHKSHVLPPGEYIYVPQVENTDFGNRAVLD